MSKRQQDRRARRAEAAAASATTAVAQSVGTAAERTASAVSRAGTALELRTRTSAPAVGTAVGSAVDAAVDGAGTARELVGRWGSTAAGVAGELVETVQGLVEEPAVRGGAALHALRGIPVGPPAARRRWPWAVLAAVAGASAGAAVAVAVRRLSTTDAPGAQEPHELRAVVDVAPDAQPTRPASDPQTPASPA